MSDIKNTIGFRVRTLSVAIKRAVDARRECKCTNTHGWVIGYLVENSHRDVYQRDIEKQFSVSRATMTEILKLMEKNGLIERVADETDRRLKKIKLTELALEIDAKHKADIKEFEELIKEGLTEAELKGFFEVVNKISANVERIENEAKQNKAEVKENA
jgi:DNA-binding MarR family transcriptional regulator